VSTLQEAARRLLGIALILIPSQVETFMAILEGLVKGEQAGIAAIGRKMPGDSKAKSKMNRVYRFVSNPRVEVGAVCEAMIRSLAMSGRTVVVATDWSEIGPLSVLASAVVIDGRAIPIYWTVVDDTVTRKKAVEVEHMRQLSAMLAGIDAIHVLDRGFDDGDFLRTISPFCSYVIRCSKGFSYRKLNESEFKNIDNFPLKRGRRHDLGQVEYTKTHKTLCRLVLFHDHNQKEPWILATNRYDDHRSTVVYCYACRFRIEEAFKDLKDLRSGFALHGYRMKIPDHLSRLLAVVAVGYLLTQASGHYGEENGLHRELQINTRKDERELATWRVGIHLLQQNTVTVEELAGRFTLLPLYVDEGLQDRHAGETPGPPTPVHGEVTPHAAA
jgi:hypothetical protein